MAHMSKNDSPSRIFVVLFIAVFAAMLGIGIIAPLMAIYAVNLKASGIWLGVIFSAFSLSRGILMPVVGKMSDTHGRKNLLLIGLFIYSLSSFGYVWSDTIPKLIEVRLIHGIASAMVVPIAMAYVGDISPKGKEGTFMGTFNSSMFLGMGMGPFIGGVINDMAGMDNVFYVMGLLSLFSFLLILAMLPESGAVGKGKKAVSATFREMFRNDVVKGLFLYRAVNTIGIGAILAFLPILADLMEISSSRIGIILSLNIVLLALLQRPFGKLADRRTKTPLIISGSILAALALFLMPFASGFYSLLFLSLVMGIGSAISIPAATAITVILGKKYGMGGIMGIFNTGMSVGMVLSPVLSGVVMDTLGLNYVFYIGGVASMLGVVTFYYYLNKQ
jgi:DHA1 family multidrug resistance protein-like MFS transporter